MLSNSVITVATQPEDVEKVIVLETFQDTIEQPEKSKPEPDSEAIVPLPPTFPEGGVRGWLTVAGAFLVQYCTFGYTNAFGVYEDFYVRSYLTRYTASDIGWIGGVQIFLIFSSGIFAGRLVDRGYFHHLMISGAFMHSLAIFMLSLSQQNQYYQVFLTQGILHGLSAGVCYTPTLAIVSHYFQKKRPLAMGVVTAGSALGAVLHPIMLNKLFHDSLGFHSGVRVSAGLNTVLLIIANLIMRTRLPPKKEGRAIPIADFLRDPPYIFAVFSGMTIFFGLFFPVFYLQLDAVSRGVGGNLSFYSLSILNAGSIFGRTIPSYFAPRVGVFNLLSFAMGGTGVVILCMLAVKDTVGVIVFAVFYGFFSGATVALTGPMLAILSRNVNEVGARMGIDFFFSGIIGLFATPIAGALLTAEYHWSRAIIFSGVTVIFSSACMVVSRFYIAKRKGRQIV